MRLFIKLRPGEDISGLLRESLLKQAIGGNDRSVTLILWNYAIFPLNRFELNKIKQVNGPLGHAHCKEKEQ